MVGTRQPAHPQAQSVSLLWCPWLWKVIQAPFPIWATIHMSFILAPCLAFHTQQWFSFPLDIRALASPPLYHSLPIPLVHSVLPWDSPSSVQPCVNGLLLCVQTLNTSIFLWTSLSLDHTPFSDPHPMISRGNRSLENTPTGATGDATRSCLCSSGKEAGNKYCQFRKTGLFVLFIVSFLYLLIVHHLSWDNIF